MRASWRPPGSGQLCTVDSILLAWCPRTWKRGEGVQRTPTTACLPGDLTRIMS
jgi:hypothetical protein